MPLPDTSVEEPERCSLFVIDEELRECLSGGVETSTPMKSHIPIDSKRKSSILEESP